MDLKTFFENFDTLAEAPGGIARLRELILDMAVRGKLVPQNSEDESAEELRKRIAIKKKELEKEKLIPKQRNSSPLEAEEKMHRIPDSWLWCRWNDIALHIGDIDHKMPPSASEGIPYVSPRDFKEKNTIDFDNAKKITLEDFHRLRRKVQPKKGDIRPLAKMVMC